jgi:hypothetical protein
MGPSMCRIDDDAIAMVHLSMGWAPASQVYARRTTPNPDAGYVCGKAKHDAAVARRRKRKKGGKR